MTRELITAATEAIKRRYRNDWQEVGAALRTRDGRIYAGVNRRCAVARRGRSVAPTSCAVVTITPLNRFGRGGR